MQLLKNAFNEEEVKEILKLPVSQNASEDKLV